MTRRRLHQFLAPAILALVLVQLPGAPASAAPNVRWKKPIAVGLNATAVDSAGDVYATGFKINTGSVRQDRFMVLYKLDATGAPIWKRAWRPRHANAWGNDLAIGPDGSVYLAGFVGLDHFEGGGWFVRRYSPSGDLEWQRATPKWKKGAVAQGITAIAVGAGLVVVSGNDFGCCGEVANDGWVRAWDLDGTPTWTNAFEAPSPTGTNDGANGIAVGRSGGIYVAGWIAMAAEMDETSRADHEIIVQRLDPAGRVVWTHVFLDSGRRDRDEARSIAVQGDEVVVAAESGGSWHRYRPTHSWLARITPAGGVEWTRSWGKQHRRHAQPASVSISPAGEIGVVGTKDDPADHGTDAFVRSFTSDGAMRWKLALDEGQPQMAGTDVFAIRGGATVTGSVGNDDGGGGGWLWRLAG